MRAVGIILAGGNSNKMRELTHKRAVAAMRSPEVTERLTLHSVICQTLIFRRWQF